MNVHDLTTIIRKADNSISGSQGTAIVSAVFDGITAALAHGDEVRIAGFGTFTVAKRAAGEGRNPRTGEAIKFAAKRVPKFTPHTPLKEALNLWNL